MRLDHSELMDEFVTVLEVHFPDRSAKNVASSGFQGSPLYFSHRIASQSIGSYSYIAYCDYFFGYIGIS